MIFGELSITERMRLAISDPEKAPMRIEQIVTEEVREFRGSAQYKEMLLADAYYNNFSDVQNKQMAESGNTNTKIEHPILKKLIKQKADYLLGKPFSISSKSSEYAACLSDVFCYAVRRKLRRMCKDSIKYGIAWLQPYFADGKLNFMRIPAPELIPEWADAEQTLLNAFIRVYDQTVYAGTRKCTVTHAELWTAEGVMWFKTAPYTASLSSSAACVFEIDREHGTEESGWIEPHFNVGGTAYNWNSVPLVWVKYDDENDAAPLLHDVKEIIDDINWQKSITADVLRDIVNFIYVLKNYGGQNLGEFLEELKKNKAIKVDADGGVDRLSADLNIDAVVKHLNEQRRDLYDYANAVDTKDPDLGNASGAALKFRYMALDNECAALGDEFRTMFEQLKPFIDTYLQIIGKGDFKDVGFNVTFNMDMPVNETEVIQSARDSKGIISNRTIIENHPWVKDVDEEEMQIEKENSQAIEKYGEGLFGGALSVSGSSDGNGGEKQ